MNRLRFALAPRRARRVLPFERWRVLVWPAPAPAPGWRGRLEDWRARTLPELGRRVQRAGARLSQRLCALRGHGPEVCDHEHGCAVYRCLACWRTRPRLLRYERIDR